MTYCLALNLDAGLVLLADSRTNAGVDNISTYGKLFTWSVPREAPNARVVGIMTAGNLSITQEVLALIEEENAAAPPADGSPVPDTILTAPNMFRVAQRVGQLMAEVQGRQGPALGAAGVSSAASLLLAGQIGAERTRLFLIYPPGNFIESTPDTPFMQIGELKYGKPILDRSVSVQTSLETGVKAAVLSMDATLRSNLSVGLPLDLAVSEAGSLGWRLRRIEEADADLQKIRTHWRDQLNAGLETTPALPF
ncbi:MAG: peptidase [Pseudomonadota bacterium]